MNRTEVETEVRKRRQTPEWAERQAEANGWEPYAPVQTPWSYWGGAGKWPINFAVLWMSCPTPEEATLQWNRLHYWGQHVWRDVPDRFHFVQNCLSENLRKDHLKGYGKKNVTDAEFALIPQDQWENLLNWETDSDYTTASIPGKTPSWLDVRVARSDVLKLGSDSDAANDVDVESEAIDLGMNAVQPVNTKIEAEPAPQPASDVTLANQSQTTDLEPILEPESKTELDTTESKKEASPSETELIAEIKSDLEAHTERGPRDDPKRFDTMVYILKAAATGGDPLKKRRGKTLTEVAHAKLAGQVSRDTYRQARKRVPSHLYDKYYDRYDRHSASLKNIK